MRKPRCSPPASPPSDFARRCSSPPPARAPMTLPRQPRSATFRTGSFCAAAMAASFSSPAGGCRSTAPSSGSQTPKSGAFVRRARVELRGWLGRLFYFDVSGDFAPEPVAGTDVAPSALPATDNYLAFAPFGDRLIVQAGQFDVPFTLENRTSDAYTDFIERAMVARSLGAPRNKEVGVMVHGLLGDGRLLLFGRRVQRRRARSSATSTTSRTPSGAWWRRRSRGSEGAVRRLVDRRLGLVRANHVLGPSVAGAGDAGRDGVLRTALDDAARRRRGRSSCTSTGPSPPSAAS